MGIYRFCRCRRCASLWVENPPDREEVAAIYGDERYFGNPHFAEADSERFHGYLDYLSDREHIEAKFHEVLGHVETQVSPGALLDVGAGPGFMLSAARERGWDASGIDVNPWAVSFAQERLGVDVREGSLPDPGIETNGCDAVTLMDLVEHVPDPGEIVGEAARILRPGGMIAVLTPDAGSPVSRLLGRRWPEVIRAPEHLVLFSVRGLAALLRRHGLEPLGWHSIGKESSLATLLADVSRVAPGPVSALERLVAGTRVADGTFELDPRTKFCMYARLPGDPVERIGRPESPPRLPKRAPAGGAEENVLGDLRKLAAARRLADWMFDQFAPEVRGAVVEVGAGIGTFSERLLGAGTTSLLALEPHPACADALAERLGGDARVTIAREEVPGSASLAAARGECDLVLCQNVLEHVGDDRAAVAEMASALRPGGSLALLVPAHPRLYGALDSAYGHRRRYTREGLLDLLRGSGLEPQEVRAFNLLGVAGWWTSNRTRRNDIGPGALRLYEALVGAWRPIEDAVRPRWGLSLVAMARRP